MSPWAWLAPLTWEEVSGLVEDLESSSPLPPDRWSHGPTAHATRPGLAAPCHIEEAQAEKLLHPTHTWVPPGQQLAASSSPQRISFLGSPCTYLP